MLAAFLREASLTLPQMNTCSTPEDLRPGPRKLSQVRRSSARLPMTLMQRTCSLCKAGLFFTPGKKPFKGFLAFQGINVCRTAPVCWSNSRVRAPFQTWDKEHSAQLGSGDHKHCPTSPGPAGPTRPGTHPPAKE